MRKLITSLTIFSLLLVQVLPVRALDAPPAPDAPSAPASQDSPPPPPDAPSSPEAPQPDSPPDPDPVSAPDSAPTQTTDDTQPADSTPEDSQAPQDSPADQEGQTGDVSITTGDTTNSALLVTDANSNIALDDASVSIADQPSGIQVANSGNGASSDNSGSASISDNNTTAQDNQASVNNQLEQSSVTGDNSASYNVGSSQITTGDANVAGTVITSVNTNLDGVSVSEFNIADDQRGDYVLDFAANCISGCSSPTSVANTGNGALSQNSAAATTDSTNTTLQNNDAQITSDLTLAADSGQNQASFNVGGDSAITTGDANVSASALTFANNNLAGGVIYGVVNIYGNLVGDIIFPEELLGCCGSFTNVANTNNGADSANTASVQTTNTDATFQTNATSIDNVLVLDSNTGSNEISGNTGGSSAVTTGSADSTVSVLNVANSNISGGTWWLVLVNEAGQWIGHILGAPEDTNFAGSSGSEFSVSPSGVITATNSNNGAGSQNQADVSSNTANTTVQTNDTHLVNQLNLSANTGRNLASYNTGGDSQIHTGDASIIANLVNFVGNNIASPGRLVITVVNVFGSWLGDFVTPGHTKPQAETVPAIGGAPVSTTTSSSTTNNSSSASSTSSSSVSQPEPTPLIARVNPPRVLSSATAAFQPEPEDPANPQAVPQAPIKPVVHINLAWLLLALPAAGLWWFISRRRRFNIANAS